jgi:hypothetical protein
MITGTIRLPGTCTLLIKCKKVVQKETYFIIVKNIFTACAACEIMS